MAELENPSKVLQNLGWGQKIRHGLATWKLEHTFFYFRPWVLGITNVSCVRTYTSYRIVLSCKKKDVSNQEMQQSHTIEYRPTKAP